MFGSDYPTVPVSVDYSDVVDTTARLFQQNQEAIFSENAREFYGKEELSV
jgi:predicted TIM-barrel fold metal-dependent hydrolase